MLEALESDYIRTARAKGVAETRVLWVHALRRRPRGALTLVPGPG